jgi:hypothetical protein
VFLADAATKFAHQGDMLAHISGKLPELWIILHKALHVPNRIDVHIVLGLDLVLLHIFLDILAQVAEILVHVLLEEWILILRENDLLQLGPDLGHVSQVNPSVVDAYHLMYHSLVCPLGEQRGDGIIPAIQYKQYRWGIGLSEVEQLLLLGQLVADLRRQLPSQ